MCFIRPNVRQSLKISSSHSTKLCSSEVTAKHFTLHMGQIRSITVCLKRPYAEQNAPVWLANKHPAPAPNITAFDVPSHVLNISKRKSYKEERCYSTQQVKTGDQYLTRNRPSQQLQEDISDMSSFTGA